MFNSNILKLFFCLLTFFILFSSDIFSQRKVFISPKFSTDLAGNHSVSLQEQKGDLSVNTGYSIGFEVVSNQNETFNLGGGLSYLFPREQEVEGSGKFNFIPIYAIGNLEHTKDENIDLSIILNVGYNVIFNGDKNYRDILSLSGGLLLGGGIRYRNNLLFIEALYKSFGGSARFENPDTKIEFDINYTTLSLGIGLLI